ncbi:MAG TPA: hypothetical protein VI755_08490 [Anaerolineales bacterium]|jgi:hypothetical protein|nr:hypothetical protein [Anaerolineales bacterium]
MTSLSGFEDFVQLLIEGLQAAGVEYLIGGAIAAWAWGEPRATQDVDMVVNIPIEAIGKLSRELEKRDMLVPPEVILDTILEERADLPISPIHISSGFKADLYPIRTSDELRQSAFERRRLVDFGPPFGEVFIHSPEDLILYKLLYFSISQQPKHSRDIAAILRAMKDRLDYPYIEHWVNRLGHQAIWEELSESVE